MPAPFTALTENNSGPLPNMHANIPIQGLSSEELWNWLLKKPHKLIAMTAFGDMFLQDEEGRVHFLDLVSGELESAAVSTAELQTLVTQSENRQRWFLMNLLTEIEHAGHSLSPGQCFAFKKPPALGGKLELANVEIAPLAVQISIMGQIHQQVKHQRPGSRITGVRIR
jgi:hypothetical protein